MSAATTLSVDALIAALELARATTDELRARYEPAKKAADRATFLQMRLYHEIKDMEAEIKRLSHALQALGMETP